MTGPETQFHAVVAKVSIDTITVTLKERLDADAARRYAPLVVSYAGSVGLGQYARRVEAESYLRHSTRWMFDLH